MSEAVLDEEAGSWCGSQVSHCSYQMPMDTCTG